MALDDTETEIIEADGSIRAAIDAAIVAAEPVAEDIEAAEKAETEEPEAHEAPETDAEKEPEPAEKPTAVEAPPTWSAADKEMLKKLPPEAAEFLLRRERDTTADYTRKTQQIAEFRKDFEPVAQLLSPHMAQIRAAGFTPATLIQAWHGVEAKLVAGQGLEVVRDLVTNYKIDKYALARELGLTAAATPAAGIERPAAPDAASGVQLPPEVINELNTLKQRQHQFDQFLTNQQQTAYREQENRVMSTIVAFRDAKSPDGALLHPHYDELENDMIAQLAAARTRGHEPTLDELYETAVWANTSTRGKVLAEQNAAHEAQRKSAENQARKDARAKAEQARRAGSSVTGAPGSGQSPSSGARGGDMSLRDALSAAFDDVAA